MYATGNFDDISLRSLENTKTQRLEAIYPADLFPLRTLVANIGYIAQLQLVFGVDHRVSDLLHIFITTNRADIDLFTAFNHPATRKGQILCAYIINRLEEVDPVTVHLALVPFDENLFIHRPPDLDIAYPVDSTQCRLEIGVDQITWIRRSFRKNNGSLHDRNIVLVPASNKELFDLVGQFGHYPIEAVLHLCKNQLQIRPPLELDHRIATSTLGIGTDRLDPTDLGDRLLQMMYHLLFDLDCTGVGIAGPDKESGPLETFGQKRQRNPRVGDISHYQQCQE